MSTMAVFLSVTTVALNAAPPPPNSGLPPSVRAILEKPDGAVLYSLDARAEGDTKELFRGRMVLGKTAVTGQKARGLLDQLLKSSAPWDTTIRKVLVANPWHGLRVTSRGKSVDLVIDFQWRWLTAHVSDQQVGKFTISRNAQAALDKLLQDGKVAIAARRKEDETPPIVKTVLEKGELIEVYSLEPTAAKDAKGERLHGYKILGKVPIKAGEAGKKLTGEIAAALVPDEYSPFLMGWCFSPRHAYRLKYKGLTVDLLICFECDRIRLLFGDEKPLGRIALQEGWRVIRSEFALYECKAQPVVDKLLREAKVPLAKKRKVD